MARRRAKKSRPRKDDALKRAAARILELERALVPLARLGLEDVPDDAGVWVYVGKRGDTNPDLTPAQLRRAAKALEGRLVKRTR